MHGEMLQAGCVAPGKVLIHTEIRGPDAAADQAHAQALGRIEQFLEQGRPLRLRHAQQIVAARTRQRGAEAGDGPARLCVADCDAGAGLRFHDRHFFEEDGLVLRGHEDAGPVPFSARAQGACGQYQGKAEDQQASAQYREKEGRDLG